MEWFVDILIVIDTIAILVLLVAPIVIGSKMKDKR